MGGGAVSWEQHWGVHCGAQLARHEGWHCWVWFSAVAGVTAAAGGGAPCLKSCCCTAWLGLVTGAAAVLLLLASAPGGLPFVAACSLGPALTPTGEASFCMAGCAFVMAIEGATLGDVAAAATGAAAGFTGFAGFVAAEATCATTGFVAFTGFAAAAAACTGTGLACFAGFAGAGECAATAGFGRMVCGEWADGAPPI